MNNNSKVYFLFQKVTIYGAMIMYVFETKFGEKAEKC